MNWEYISKPIQLVNHTRFKDKFDCSEQVYNFLLTRKLSRIEFELHNRMEYTTFNCELHWITTITTIVKPNIAYGM